MAFTVSRARIAPTMVKKGGTSTPSAATDDILTFNSAVVADPTFDTFEFRPHGNSFTRGKDLIGVRTSGVNFTFLLQGGSSAGTVGLNENGVLAIDAAMYAAGNDSSSSNAGTITWKPATLAQLSPSTVWTDHHGALHKMANVYGNIVMSGNPTSGIECRFTGVGTYVAPILETTEFDSWTGGTNRADAFLNATVQIASSSGTITPVVQSFEFDMGIDVQRILDANDTTGLKALLLADRNPRLTLTIALDTDSSANLTYAEIYTDLTGSTTHNLTWNIGSSPDNIAFSFPTAQLTNVTLGETNGYRTLALAYKVQHATAESEYSIAIT